MKTGFLAVLYVVISNLAILFCFIPFFYLSWKKMRQVSAYRAIAVYWLINGLINLPNTDLLGPVQNSDLQDKLNFFYTLAETPLVLVVFGCAASGIRRRRIMWFTPLFVVCELGLIAWKGYNFITSTVIIGAGMIIILAYCITGLLHYMRQMEHTPFENSIAFVYAALLFAYSSFLIIYIFIHLHQGVAAGDKDSFLLYYIGLLLSASLTSLGLWGYGLRKRYSSHPS